MKNNRIWQFLRGIYSIISFMGWKAGDSHLCPIPGRTFPCWYGKVYPYFTTPQIRQMNIFVAVGTEMVSFLLFLNRWQPRKKFELPDKPLQQRSQIIPVHFSMSQANVSISMLIQFQSKSIPLMERLSIRE